MYFQLKEELIALIKNGTLATGDKIYSETDLCNKYEVSRITAKRALNELVQEGYIERIPGRGSFISRARIDHALNAFYSFTEEIKKLGMVPSSKILKCEKIVPNSDICSRLNITNGKVYYIMRQRFADGEIIALDHSYIPCSILPSIDQKSLETESLYEKLTNIGYMPERAIESFTATQISAEEAKLLEMEEKSAALKVYRLTYHENQVIEYNYRYYKGNRYIYTIELK
jgi:GntR family transcriptional regulator